MRLQSNFLCLATAALLALTVSCGGSDTAEADPFSLIQSEDFQGAIQLIEPQLQTVAKGSPEHKELVLLYTEALSAESPEEAGKEFTEAMDAHEGMIGPKDVRYIVDRMVAKDHLTDAIEVMHHGKETWPEDETMKVVLDELIKVVTASGDEGAQNKMKGMGYL